jgi:hypothetical protein
MGAAAIPDLGLCRRRKAVPNARDSVGLGGLEFSPVQRVFVGEGAPALPPFGPGFAVLARRRLQIWAGPAAGGRFWEKRLSQTVEKAAAPAPRTFPLHSPPAGVASLAD